MLLLLTGAKIALPFPDRHQQNVGSTTPTACFTLLPACVVTSSPIGYERTEHHLPQLIARLPDADADADTDADGKKSPSSPCFRLIDPSIDIEIETIHAYYSPPLLDSLAYTRVTSPAPNS